MKYFIFVMVILIPLSCLCMEKISSLKPWNAVEESDKEYRFKRAILISDLDLFLDAAKDILHCEIPVKDFSRTVVTDGIKTSSSLKSVVRALESYQAKADEIFTGYNDEKSSSEKGTYIKCGGYFVIQGCIALPVAYYFGSADLFWASWFIPAGASAVTIKNYYQKVEDSEQIKEAMKVICDRAKLQF